MLLMASVGIRELRLQTRAVLQKVVAGESVDITEHGHPIARIVPLRPGTLEQMHQDHRATRARADLLDLLEELSLPAPLAGHQLASKALEELRSAED